MILSVSFYLALALPGVSGSGTVQPPAPAPAMIDMSSPSSVTADLAALAPVSNKVPLLAVDAVVIKPVITPIKPVKKPETPVFFGTRSWLTMTAIQHSTAAFDAWSTRRSITSGNGHELNPLMKPFAGSGAIYGAIQLAPIATDFLGKRLMNSKHPTLRKLWWLPQAAGSVGFTLSSIQNLRVASSH